MLELIPDASVSGTSVRYRKRRDRRKTIGYYDKLPPEKTVDIASYSTPCSRPAGSIDLVIRRLKKVAAVSTSGVLSISRGDNPGIDRTTRDFPDVKFSSPRSTPELNERKMASVPGLATPATGNFRHAL